MRCWVAPRFSRFSYLAPAASLTRCAFLGAWACGTRCCCEAVWGRPTQQWQPASRAVLVLGCGAMPPQHCSRHAGARAAGGAPRAPRASRRRLGAGPMGVMCQLCSPQCTGVGCAAVLSRSRQPAARACNGPRAGVWCARLVWGGRGAVTPAQPSVRGRAARVAPVRLLGHATPALQPAACARCLCMCAPQAARRGARVAGARGVGGVRAPARAACWPGAPSGSRGRPRHGVTGTCMELPNTFTANKRMNRNSIPSHPPQHFGGGGGGVGERRGERTNRMSKAAAAERHPEQNPLWRAAQRPRGKQGGAAASTWLEGQVASRRLLAHHSGARNCD